MSNMNILLRAERWTQKAKNDLAQELDELIE
jgi:hypothetical protein